ncbi:MAG: type 1 glutamine amidotransferase [Acidiferrobacteraceae bacterium]
MKRFAVVQHTYSEFLGLIENQLEKRDIGFHYLRPFVGQQLPSSAGQFDALFLLGGKVPATDRRAVPWADDEIALIAAFRDARRPVVGFGFGAQMVVAQAGGVIRGDPFHQAYWTTAHKTPAGASDAVGEAVDGRRVLVLYNGSADLPAGIEPLVVDDEGRWLLARTDPLSYAVLFRPELKPGMIEDMVMEAKRITPPNITALLEEARSQWAATQATTDRFVVALAKELDLMTERRKTPVFSINVSE